jgi:hypothetical protein
MSGFSAEINTGENCLHEVLKKDENSILNIARIILGSFSSEPGDLVRFRCGVRRCTVEITVDGEGNPIIYGHSLIDLKVVDCSQELRTY